MLLKPHIFLRHRYPKTFKFFASLLPDSLVTSVTSVTSWSLTIKKLLMVSSILSLVSGAVLAAPGGVTESTNKKNETGAFIGLQWNFGSSSPEGARVQCAPVLFYFGWRKQVPLHPIQGDDDQAMWEKMVPQEGFEPPTPSLRMRCSTS